MITPLFMSTIDIPKFEPDKSKSNFQFDQYDVMLTLWWFRTKKKYYVQVITE